MKAGTRDQNISTFYMGVLHDCFIACFSAPISRACNWMRGPNVLFSDRFEEQRGRNVQVAGRRTLCPWSCLLDRIGGAWEERPERACGCVMVRHFCCLVTEADGHPDPTLTSSQPELGLSLSTCVLKAISRQSPVALGCEHRGGSLNTTPLVSVALSKF